MKFNLIGQGNFADDNLPRQVKEAIAVLSKLKDGDVFSLRDLASELQIQTASFRQHTAHTKLKPFRFCKGCEVFFGNKRTAQAGRQAYPRHNP